MNIRQFAKGDAVFSAGDRLTHAYVIESGEVEITIAGAKHVKTAGALFGDLALVRDVPADQTAIALSDVTLRLLSLDQIEALALQAPKEIQQLLESLALAQSAPPVSSHFGGTVDRVTQLLEQRCDRLEKQLAQPLGGVGADKIVPADYHTEKMSYGPLEVLLADDNVNDILINKYNEIYIEKDGELTKTSVAFNNDAEVVKMASQIALAVGRRFDDRRPILDARLADGSRVNVIAPPLAVDGTSISIRKFAKKGITLDIMKEQNNVSDSLGEFLKVIGKCRLNVVISGGTGSGKTTLLNAISNHIDERERIVTIEDAAELQLQRHHVVRLETRPFNPLVGKSEEVTMRDLVKNALRMRPDRILVGEVRGGEAFDMLQAMNTGHEGSLTTVHANHPRDALNRIENMVTMANMNIPTKSIRQQIASALHLIVQVSRMRDGKRRITYVSEVVGMEGDIITMQDLFVYAVSGEDKDGNIQGQFKWTGIMPKFTRRVAYYGEQERLARALGLKTLTV